MKENKQKVLDLYCESVRMRSRMRACVCVSTLTI